jgi:phosphoribosylpyrophosphate synthetase
MKVHFLCGYYSDLAHNKKARRTEPYWDAYFFCWAVKVGRFKKPFFIRRKSGNIRITAVNFNLVRKTFGVGIDHAAGKVDQNGSALYVPVPSKDGLSGARDFRSLQMAREALQGKPMLPRVNGGLRWKEKLTKAHEGGSRSRAALASMLQADANLKGKEIILVDDLLTTGSSLLASANVLTAAGAKVIGAVVCGKTVYDFKTPPFGFQEFELTEELADWQG